MSRFDDELRRVAESLADEPLPPGVLDEALEELPDRRWPLMAIGAVAVLVVAVGAGAVGIRDPSPSPGESPSPSASAPPEAGACEHVAPSVPVGLEVVIVYFPCQDGVGIARGVRGIRTAGSPEEQLQSTVRHVLTGPTPLEREAGMREVVPAGSQDLLIDVELQDDGLAILDFQPELADVWQIAGHTIGPGGPFEIAVRETAFQFPEVTAVEFRVGGSCDAFAALLEAVCTQWAKPVGNFADCPIITPLELPSGASVDEFMPPRPFPGEPMVSWGSGTDTVTERAWPLSEAPSIPDDAFPVVVRGGIGHVLLVGDVMVSQVQIGWDEGDCGYRIWVGPNALEDVMDYASRIGPEMSPPSASLPPEGEVFRIEGELWGDRDLETGCAWLITDEGQRWNVAWADGWEAQFPTRLPVLVGPDGNTARTGDTVIVDAYLDYEYGSLGCGTPAFAVEVVSIERR